MSAQDPMRSQCRAAVPGLASPAPLIDRLPALYAQDEFTRGFVAAFDDVLAPVLSVLDCLDAYWDPGLAPEDFVDWLATWVAADGTDAGVSAAASVWEDAEQGGEEEAGRAGAPDARIALERRRDLVARAVETHTARGTARGLADHIRLVFGLEAEIADNGGAAWSTSPVGPLPGTPQVALTVRVRPADPYRPQDVPLAEISRFVDANRPAHVPATVEIAAWPDEPMDEPPGPMDRLAGRTDGRTAGPDGPTAGHRAVRAVRTVRRLMELSEA
jgi:hypothetical protein